MYYEPDATYPDDKCCMGRWLGPAVDVGSAITYKVQKSNGHFVCRSSARPWTPKEEANPDLLREREKFMARLKNNLGRPAKVVDFPLEELTPEYSYYADDDEDGFTGCPDELDPVKVPTSEASDNYVGVSINLPRGEGMAQGRVTKRARDNDGNVVGRAHNNPILVCVVVTCSPQAPIETAHTGCRFRDLGCCPGNAVAGTSWSDHS